jgi:methylated-DNA-[protein]-cysteine S-methyltransferase
MDWVAVPSPIGPLGVAADATGIRAITFTGPAAAATTTPGAALLAAADQLAGYFAGHRTGFRLPLAGQAGTAFERAVWAEIAAIPYGEMRTYGQLAGRLGDPGAARAVGVACHRNPLPIVWPCHRVVGAGGKLVGFGGGLPRKRYLLELEARVCIERQFTG